MRQITEQGQLEPRVDVVNLLVWQQTTALTLASAETPMVECQRCVPRLGEALHVSGDPCESVTEHHGGKWAHPVRQVELADDCLSLVRPLDVSRFHVFAFSSELLAHGSENAPLVRRIALEAAFWGLPACVWLARRANVATSTRCLDIALARNVGLTASPRGRRGGFESDDPKDAQQT